MLVQLQPRLSRIIAIVAGSFLFTAFIPVYFSLRCSAFWPLWTLRQCKAVLLLIHEVELPVRVVLDAILLLFWLS